MRADFVVTEKEALRRVAADEMRQCGFDPKGDLEPYLRTPLEAFSQLVGSAESLEVVKFSEARLEGLGEVITTLEIFTVDEESDLDGEFPWRPLCECAGSEGAHDRPGDGSARP